METVIIWCLLQFKRISVIPVEFEMLLQEMNLFLPQKTSVCVLRSEQLKEKTFIQGYLAAVLSVFIEISFKNLDDFFY